MNVSASEALQRLQQGNQRFVAGKPEGDSTRPVELAEGQQPFAIIVGCSDSRVPAELVFNQGLGDLFVIRVAGNIVAPTQIGSVEFAAAKFGTPLVVVLGHSNCGAIRATVEELVGATESQSSNLQAIVTRIKPAVEGLLDSEQHDHEVLVEKAVRANITASVDQLRHGSEILEQLINEGQLQIVGAEYCLQTGKVAFLED